MLELGVPKKDHEQCFRSTIKNDQFYSLLLESLNDVVEGLDLLELNLTLLLGNINDLNKRTKK